MWGSPLLASAGIGTTLPYSTPCGSDTPTGVQSSEVNEMSVAKPRLTVVVLAASALLAACGGSTTPASGVRPALGSPGDPTKASRTVEVQAGDDLRFHPDSVQVKVGETITFRVVNVAKIEHDFTLGDDQAQAVHENEMRSMSPGDAMNMADGPNAIHIAPGETKSITWTFTTAGTTRYGCHELGHYAGGMKGTVTVS